MFMGPFEQSKVWDTGAVSGIRKFLDKVHRYFNENEISNECPPKELISLTHQTVKIVGNHIDDFKFNTAISQLMVWMNAFSKLTVIPKIAGGRFIRLLSPFAPHLAEEIWTTKFKPKSKTIAFEQWPTYKEKWLVLDVVTYAIQINGKVRGEIKTSNNTPKKEVIADAKKIENITKWLKGKTIVKEIFIPGKIIGFVVK
jgi:leucyl-tRNA synthetase